MKSLLRVENITKLYPGVRALNGVDFNLRPGEVHCLVGENGSGKSTLIKIISGVIQPEFGGRIRFDGAEIDELTAREAIDLGIRVIYQDLALFPNLTVKENIAFGLYGDTPGIRANWRRIEARAREASEQIGLQLDMDRLVESLSIAEQQQVEIARAIMGNVKLLILDEPTSSLTRMEILRLFEFIARLKARGVTTLFVSHKLDEVFKVAERITVLRDGELIGVFEPSEINRSRLVFLMTGKELDVRPPAELTSSRGFLLEVERLSKRDQYSNISFTVRRGEILGITGRLGSGRTDLAMSLFGMNPPDGGTIRLNGKIRRFRNNKEAVRSGIAYVPENRLEQGLVMPQSIAANTTLVILGRLLNKAGLLARRRQRAEAGLWVRELSIKTVNVDMAVETLSGGNQQKVVLSKWLAAKPQILILDKPTVGIDVLAKNSIHDIIKMLASDGIGIIFISDEMHEVLSNSHRVLVMDGGKIVNEIFPGPEIREQEREKIW